MSVAVACWAAEARAADEFVYVVNGAGAPLQVVVDGQAFPPMDHLMAVNVRAAPGRHIIAAGEPRPIVQGQIQSVGTSISPDLRADAGIVDQQNTFWCFIVGKQADGALRIISPSQPTCAELVRRGVGDRQLK
jgi:hypothetical protein